MPGSECPCSEALTIEPDSGIVHSKLEGVESTGMGGRVDIVPSCSIEIHGTGNELSSFASSIDLLSCSLSSQVGWSGLIEA